MNKEPLLVINVELNLGYRPQIVIFKDTNIDNLIEQFILEHDLKPTAIGIIRQLITDNLKTKPLTKIHQKNYTQWKTHHQKERTKENYPKYNKPKVVKKESPRPSLLEMSFNNKDTSQNKQIKKPEEGSFGEIQKQFQRQFKRIKLQRTVAKQQQNLKLIYQKLTKQNPPGIEYITPEFIDFSSFTAQFLTILQDFFEVLNEQDFMQLDFHKFKQLIQKYHYGDLFKIQKKFS